MNRNFLSDYFMGGIGALVSILAFAIVIGIPTLVWWVVAPEDHTQIVVIGIIVVVLGLIAGAGRKDYQ
jgi:hypothetical protein